MRLAPFRNMVRSPSVQLFPAWIVSVVVAGCAFDATSVLSGGSDNRDDRSSIDGGAAPADDGVDAGDPGTGDIDAAPPCPPGCSSCDGAICRVDCSGSRCNTGTDILCPPGWSCLIECTGRRACRDGRVRCIGDCEIVCRGDEACERSPVECQGNGCAISCDGSRACDQGVDCTAIDCAIECTGQEACGSGACCAGTDCGADCTASAGGSCTCQ